MYIFDGCEEYIMLTQDMQYVPKEDGDKLPRSVQLMISANGKLVAWTTGTVTYHQIARYII
jgi:hypothetical protein